MNMSDPTIVELIGHTGMFDYVEFVAEYGPYDLYALENIGRALVQGQRQGDARPARRCREERAVEQRPGRGSCRHGERTRSLIRAIVRN